MPLCVAGNAAEASNVVDPGCPRVAVLGEQVSKDLLQSVPYAVDVASEEGYATLRFMFGPEDQPGIYRVVVQGTLNGQRFRSQ